MDESMKQMILTLLDGHKLKMPSPEEVALFRVVRQVVSVLDYAKGFARTDLVTC